MSVLIIYVLYWTIIGGIGGLLIAAAMHKPRASGFVVGALLGIFGWLLILVSKGNVKKCPNCAEQVQKAARVCRYCHYEFARLNGDQSGVAPRPAQPPIRFPTARMLRREWIHDAPTTMSRDFGRVAAGEEVAVLDAKGKYTRIRARDGREGWAHTKSISKEPSADDDQSAGFGERGHASDERAEPAPTPLVRTLSPESSDFNPRREFVAEIKDGFRRLRHADFKRGLREWYRELWQWSPPEGSSLPESSPRSDSHASAPRE